MEKGAQDDQGEEGRMDEKLRAPHVNPENPGATDSNQSNVKLEPSDIAAKI